MDKNNQKLQIFTVYYKPRDFPSGFVARKFDGEEPTNIHFAHTDYNKVRDWVYEQFKELPQGYPYRIPRQEGDDPCIKECWI